MSSYGSLNVTVEVNESMNRKAIKGDNKHNTESRRLGKIVMVMSLVLIGSAAWYHGGFETSSRSQWLRKQFMSFGGSWSRSDISFGSVVKSTTEYPFTVRLSVGFPSGAEVCTGSILSPNYVLTAGHCVHKKGANLTLTPDKVTVYAGTTARFVKQPRSYQVRRAEAVYVDPEYRQNNRDLAVVRLLGPFLMTPSVNSIPLTETRPSPETLSVALGWGSVDNKHVTDVLRSATMYVISDAACKLKDPRELCTQGGSGNTCKGDSGGPLVVGAAGNEHLVGVNSWSVTDCNNLTHNIDVFEGVTTGTTFVESIVTVPPPLELMVKPGQTPQTSVEGAYSQTDKLVFDKHVWENGQTSMVIAFNGNEWVVANANAVSGVPAKGFGGVVASTNGDVDIGCAVFADYVLAPSSIAMKLKDGQTSYVGLDGGYERQKGTFVNGYPVYVQGDFFIGRSGSKWCASLTSMLDGIVKNNKVNFAGYYKTSNTDTTVTCANFAKYDIGA